MRKTVIIVNILLIGILLTSCGSSSTNLTQKPSSTSEIVTNTDNAKKSTPTGTEGTVKSTSTPNPIDNTNGNIASSPDKIGGSVKSEYYDIEEFVSSYCESVVYAVNNNDFNLIKKQLDEKSSIYAEEKQYIENSFTIGNRLKLVYCIINDTKQYDKNTYSVNATIKLEITDSSNNKTTQIIKKAFSVYDEGNNKKILSIKSMQ